MIAGRSHVAHHEIVAGQERNQIPGAADDRPAIKSSATGGEICGHQFFRARLAIKTMDRNVRRDGTEQLAALVDDVTAIRRNRRRARGIGGEAWSRECSCPQVANKYIRLSVRVTGPQVVIVAGEHDEAAIRADAITIYKRVSGACGARIVWHAPRHQFSQTAAEVTKKDVAGSVAIIRREIGGCAVERDARQIRGE